MIISGGRNYIFVHIPKTGGTAMALALEDRAMADDIMLGDTPKATRRRRRVGENPSEKLHESVEARAADAMPVGMVGMLRLPSRTA